MKILLIVFILLINISHADSQVNPKRIIHRIQDTTLGKSGWYYGKSTDGHFSVELPVPFNDFTLKGDGRFTYCIGSISPEGIKFSATEMPNKDKSSKVDLDGMIEKFDDTNTIVSNIFKSQDNASKSVYFELKNDEAGAFIKYIYSRNRLYALIIEYPANYQKRANEFKERYFLSFKNY